MYCNQCGTRVDDDALTCPNCGEELPFRRIPVVEPAIAPEVPEELVEQAEPEETEPAHAPRPRGGCGWAMAAGMLAGLAILLIVALGLVAVYQGTQERTRLNRAAALDHYYKGMQQLSLQNYELAQAEFELALQLDPRNKDVAAKLAEVKTVLGSQATPTSATRYQTAVLLYNEARELYNKGDWQGVITKLEQVRTLDPEYEREQVVTLLIEAYYKAGLRLVDENRLEEAIRYFDQALLLSPGQPAVQEQKRLASLYLAGLGYWGADWQGAIESFSVLHQLQPGYKDAEQRLQGAYVGYADALFDKEEWCVARDYYDSALGIGLSQEITAKRDQAAQYCTSAPVAVGTPAPSGTFLGRLVRVENVGLETAMMIRGQVWDAQGKPMAGVRVGLSAWDWSAPPAMTSSEGVFAFDGLGNPVTYTVTLLELPTVPLPVKADWGTLAWVEFRPQP